MSFRLRCHLMFLPLFLGFSAAAAVLAYLVEWGQVRWELDEQAQSNALCLAAFLRPTSGAGSMPDLRTSTLAATRLSRGAGGLTIAWFEPHDGRWRTRLLASTSGLLMPPVPEARVRARIRAGKPATVQRSRFGTAYDEVIGYAGLYDATGELRAIVGATAKDEVGRAERQRLGRTLAWLAAAGLLGGIVAAEILSRWVRHDLKTVAALTRGSEGGHDDPDRQPSAIEELADLSQALRAIDRILADAAQQTRRRLLRQGPGPEDSEIVRSCHDRASASVADAAAGPPRSMVRRIGRAPVDDFWAVRRAVNGWHVLIGRLDAAQNGGSVIQRHLRAEAARDYACGRLTARAVRELWPQVDAVFSLSRAVLISLRAGAGIDVVTHGSTPERIEPVAVSSGAGGDHPPTASTQQRTAPNDGRATAGEAEAPRSLLVLGTFSPPLMTAARDYIRYAQDVSRALDELAVLLADRESGLLLVLFLP